jgi:hypothetical protein
MKSKKKENDIMATMANTDYIKRTLEYVRNTGGNATKEMLFEDYEPIGEIMWNDVLIRGYVIEKDGKIFLTATGTAVLEKLILLDLIPQV